MIRCVVAIDNKRGMADDKGIPWDLPTDKQFYRDQTATGLILMGIGTYHEFHQPMHGHTNYVATHQDVQLTPGFKIVHDVRRFFKDHAGETINNIGGAGLFADTILFADELIITQIDADFHCTKFFPPYEQDFECVYKSEPISENGVTFRFTTWRRKTPQTS